MIKKFLTVLFFSFLILNCTFYIVHSPVLAKDFSSFYNTTYVFSNTGTAQVTQEISLANQKDNLYVSEYSFSTTGGKINTIEAYDKIGPLKTTINQKDKSTIITLQFNEKVAGKDKVLSFILKYKVDGLAKKEGNLWKITVPRLVGEQEIDDYQLHIKIPKQLGKVALVNPQPRERKDEGNFTLLSFSKDQVKNYGVLVTIGQYQTFNFSLLYDLSNPTSQTVLEQIALPPDTNYQTVYFSSIDPPPFRVEADEDGNWLASYLLTSKQNLTLKAEGSVNIYSEPKTSNFSEDFSPSDYLSNQKYWQVTDSQIQILAKELKTPENIYNYVVKNLNYDYSSINENVKRKGAIKALQEPEKSICTEFADLFVTLCRAAGIPARELEGFAYTENPRLLKFSINNDLLHSWPEYYDSKTKKWISVDPTWGNTTGGLDYFNKFDMTHFTFVIHGKNDSFPAPAGSYKILNDQTKQIFVSFGNEETISKEKIVKILNVYPSSIFSSKGNLLKIELGNSGGSALYSERVILNTIGVFYPSESLIENLPPFSSKEIGFSLIPPEQYKDYDLPIKINLGDKETSVIVRVKSLILRIILIGGGVLTIILLSLLFAIRKNLKAKNEIDHQKNIN